MLFYMNLSNLALAGSSGMTNLETIMNTIVTFLRVAAFTIFIGGSIYVSIQYYMTHPKAQEHRDSLAKGVICLLVLSELIAPAVKAALESFR